jgi:type II secretory pathway pseudopilin PulG
VKRKISGFTIVELLTSLAIITILVGLLMPGLTMVGNMARATKQKAQFAAIGQGLLAFRADYGDYPPSNWPTIPPGGGPPATDYCGAQKLAEALLGWDLLGFHPKSAWRADGFDLAGGLLTYDPPKTRDVDGDGTPDTLRERRDRYLDLASTNVFRLGVSAPGMQDGLFDVTAPLARDTFVLCDAFPVKSLRIGGKTVKAGTPILYYKANTSSKALDFSLAVPPDQQIYDAYHNDPLVKLGKLTDPTKPHPLGVAIENLYLFDYDGGIRDPQVTATPWPHNPDSFILISAGPDGLYGTRDDIRNF